MPTTRNRPSFESRIAAAKEQVTRIQNMPPCENDMAVLMIFADYPEESVIPRVTILPFDAWTAYGLHVKRGEKARAISTFAPVTRKGDNGSTEIVKRRDPKTGEDRAVLRPVTAHLFHISQCEPFERHHADFWTLTSAMRAALDACRAPAPVAASSIAPEPEYAATA